MRRLSVNASISQLSRTNSYIAFHHLRLVVVDIRNAGPEMSTLISLHRFRSLPNLKVLRLVIAICDDGLVGQLQALGSPHVICILLAVQCLAHSNIRGSSVSQSQNEVGMYGIFQFQCWELYTNPERETAMITRLIFGGIKHVCCGQQLTWEQGE